MEIDDTFHEIAASLLCSDAELGLTFVRIGLSHPEGDRRRTAIQRAETAYERICGLTRFVQMTDAERAQLGQKLETLHDALEGAGRNGHTFTSPS